MITEITFIEINQKINKQKKNGKINFQFFINHGVRFNSLTDKLNLLTDELNPLSLMILGSIR